MDAKIKKVIGKEKSALTETKALLKEDKKHDKVIAKAKKNMKGKCK